MSHFMDMSRRVITRVAFEALLVSNQERQSPLRCPIVSPVGVEEDSV